MRGKYLLIVAATLSLTGCISLKSYVDPGFGAVKYSEIKSPVSKYKVNVIVEFQRNGEPFPKADEELRNNVERVLRATGVVQSDFGGDQAMIKVTVNNIADLSEASAKGFGTGLTFGLAGTTVTDGYEIKILLKVNDKEVNSTYHHAIHSTIGNASSPFPGVEGTTPSVAFGIIVEHAVLKFIKEMQSQNLLL